MSGYDPATSWCHFTPKKWKRYYREINGESEDIGDRLNKASIPFYWDRHGGLHTKCSEGALWTILSGQPDTHVPPKISEGSLDAEYLIISDIAINIVPPISAIKTNKVLEKLGLQIKEDKQWLPTQSGKQYATIFENPNSKYESNTFLKWKFEIIQIIQETVGKK